MVVIGNCNVKGGVGKSMIVYQVSGYLSKLGYKVLCIDADPQHNLSNGYLNYTCKQGLMDLLDNKVKFKDVVITPYKDDEILTNIDLLPSNFDLFYFDVNEKNYLKLKEILDNSNLQYDYVLIDTNPSINILTANVLSYVDYVIGVFDSSADSITGFQYLEKSIIKSVKESVNPKLDVLGIVLNNNDTRSKIGTMTMKTIVRLYGDKLFDNDISASVKTKESRTARFPLVSYEPKHKSAIQFENLTNEIIGRLGELNGN